MATTVLSRERILDAGLRCFAQRGVLATTLEDIRREAGASTGAIYHHFPGKDALAGAVYAEQIARYQRGMLDVLREHPGAEEGVRAVVRFHVAWCGENLDGARFLLAERRTDDTLVELNRAFLAEVRSWWRTHAHYGVLRPLELNLVNALWLGPAQELCRHWLAGRAEEPDEQTIATLADAAWAALRAPEPKETS